MSRELLLHITAKDCEWQYYRGSGKGGQKRNKTSSAVRCTHKPSSAVGQAQDGRSQRHNRELAFGRMARSKEFQTWLRLEIARVTGRLAKAERWAEQEVNSSRVQVQVLRDGKWTNVPNSLSLPD